MKLTIKNKNEQRALTFTQGAKLYKGKPISSKVVLVESRLEEIDEVLCTALTENTRTAIMGFELLLPEKCTNRLKKETINGNNLFHGFISYLAPAVETELSDDNGYAPNCLRYVERKSFVRGHQPYYSYKVVILVNQLIFDDMSTCKGDSLCLIEKVILSWCMATGLEYSEAKRTFDNQDISWKEVGNLDEGDYGGYLSAHEQLSCFAFAGTGSHLRHKGGFSCSIS